jgi:hypothetical protein
MFSYRCLLLLILLAITFPCGADEIKTLAGKTVTGTLEKITDSAIVVKTDAGPVSTPLAQVLDVNLRPGKSAPEKYTEVQLADESVLRCKSVSFGAKDFKVELTTGTTITLPQAAFVSMLRDAQDGEIKKQWNKLMKTKVRGDRIFILNMGNLNSINGVLKEIDEKSGTVKFKGDATGEVAIKLERLHGMSFLRTDAPTEPSLCKVIDVEGNLLVASKIACDGEKLTMVTPFNGKVALDLKSVARLDFNFGRLTYLSDLAEKITSTPLLGGFSALRKDKNLDGFDIMLQDKEYQKGLSMYAGVELEYDLGGKYKDFKAILGVDARIAEEGQGKVLVTIYCDRDKRFSELVSTKAARAIAINVKDVSTLRIVVSGANFTNFSGHAMLANARVSQ